METKLTVVKNLGMYVVVDYEVTAYDKKKKKMVVVDAGLKVVGNPYHPNYNEMWEWDRIDREEWDKMYGRMYEEIRYKNLPKNRKVDGDKPIYIIRKR